MVSTVLHLFANNINLTYFMSYTYDVSILFPDVAQQLLKDQPDIAIAHDGNYHTALHVIARKNLPFSKLANRRQRGIFKRYFDLG